MTSSVTMVPLVNCGYEVINVTHSNYGRTQPYADVCPHPRGLTEDVTCMSPISTQLESCDGNGSCQVMMDGPGDDPCDETGKYAEVQYVCQGER